MLIRNETIAWKNETQHVRSSSQDLVTRSSSPQFSAHQVKIEPGGQINVHTHDRESELHFVISGQGEAFLDGQWKSVGPGDVVLAQPPVPHGLRNNTQTPLLVLCVFAPPLV